MVREVTDSNEIAWLNRLKIDSYSQCLQVMSDQSVEVVNGKMSSLK
jgi:hypothetical protein